jgi:glycosyltransferase involved in cell wall biosynthesis
MSRSNCCAVVVPGRFDARTGGSIYDRRIADGLRARGWIVDRRELSDTFPRPTPTDLDAAARTLASLADGAVVIIDGLAFGAMPDVVLREASRLRLVALVHLPLALEIGLDPVEADRLRCCERRALAAASLVIATGKTTIDALADSGVTRDRITLVEPGTDRAPLAHGSGSATVHLLCVAAVTAGKGHDVLIGALASIPHRNWTLVCVGSLTRQPRVSARVRELVGDRRLTDRVLFAGELDQDDLASAYDRADLFVLATRRETYGMAVAEALARGLPIVSTTTGAIPDLVGDAGLLVAPGDEAAFARALEDAIGDPARRERLATNARVRRDRLPTWDAAARQMAAAIDERFPR